MRHSFSANRIRLINHPYKQFMNPIRALFSCKIQFPESRFSYIKLSADNCQSEKWSLHPDLNRRPHPYQGCALPTELCRHPKRLKMVLGGGLEPPRIAPYGPQPYASASSATRALIDSLAIIRNRDHVPNISPVFHLFK